MSRARTPHTLSLLTLKRFHPYHRSITYALSRALSSLSSTKPALTTPHSQALPTRQPPSRRHSAHHTPRFVTLSLLPPLLPTHSPHTPALTHESLRSTSPLPTFATSKAHFTRPSLSPFLRILSRPRPSKQNCNFYIESVQT